MNTKDIRNIFKWSQKDMSENTGIPLRTIENWDLRGCLKPWLHQYILKSELGKLGFTENPFSEDEFSDPEADECPLPFG